MLVTQTTSKTYTGAPKARSWSSRDSARASRWRRSDLQSWLKLVLLLSAGRLLDRGALYVLYVVFMWFGSENDVDRASPGTKCISIPLSSICSVSPPSQACPRPSVISSSPLFVFVMP